MKKILSFILSAVLVTVIFSLCPSAKTVHKNSISLLEVRANVSGAGYNWNNYDDVLTIDGLNIDTTDEYGLKIMDGATVVIKGNNYIKASKAAIFIQGKVVFKGNGTLTLIGEENGIYCSSNDKTDVLSIVGGNYKITSGEAGIISDFHKVAISGSNLKIDTSSGIAIEAQQLTTGAKTVIRANGSLIGVKRLLIEGSSLTIETSDKALISDTPISFSKLTIKAGSSLSGLDKVESYNGEKCIKTTSTFDNSLKSIIFGDNVSIAADIILLIAVIGAVVAATVVPVVLKKNKAKKVIAARDEARRKSKQKNQ